MPTEKQLHHHRHHRHHQQGAVSTDCSVLQLHRRRSPEMTSCWARETRLLRVGERRLQGDE